MGTRFIERGFFCEPARFAPLRQAPLSMMAAGCAQAIRHH